VIFFPILISSKMEARTEIFRALVQYIPTFLINPIK
jgi:hypothetical protein